MKNAQHTIEAFEELAQSLRSLGAGEDVKAWSRNALRVLAQAGAQAETLDFASLWVLTSPRREMARAVKALYVGTGARVEELGEVRRELERYRLRLKKAFEDAVRPDGVRGSVDPGFQATFDKLREQLALAGDEGIKREVAAAVERRREVEAQLDEILRGDGERTSDGGGYRAAAEQGGFDAASSVEGHLLVQGLLDSFATTDVDACARAIFEELEAFSEGDLRLTTDVLDWIGVRASEMSPGAAVHVEDAVLRLVRARG